MCLFPKSPPFHLQILHTYKQTLDPKFMANYRERERGRERDRWSRQEHELHRRKGERWAQRRRKRRGDPRGVEVVVHLQAWLCLVFHWCLHPNSIFLLLLLLYLFRFLPLLLFFTIICLQLLTRAKPPTSTSKYGCDLCKTSKFQYNPSKLYKCHCKILRFKCLCKKESITCY